MGSSLVGLPRSCGAVASPVWFVGTSDYGRCSSKTCSSGRLLPTKNARAAAKAKVAEKYWNIDFSKAPDCANREGVLREYVQRRLSDETYAEAMQAGRSRETLYDRRLDSWGWLSPVLYFNRYMESVAGVAPPVSAHSKNRFSVITPNGGIG